jgi:hypothetical protein
MTVNLTKEDAALLEMLLTKEEGDTRVEIHHCRDHEYKEYLKAREKRLGDLLARVKDALAG